MHQRYRPSWARFDQPDPYDGAYDLTAPQSFNRYSYVNNDPVNFVDPSGLLKTICHVESNGQIRCEDDRSVFPPAPGADRGFGGWGSGGWDFNDRPSAGRGIIALREAAAYPFFIAWSDPYERQVLVPFPSMFAGWAAWGGHWGGRRGGTQRKQDFAALREQAKRECLARKKAEAAQARTRYVANYGRRVLNGMKWGAVRGAIGGGIVGGTGGFAAMGWGAIPGTAAGAFAGGTAGAAGGVITTGLFIEPLQRLRYDYWNHRPALNLAHVECDIEADAAVVRAGGP